MWVYIYGHNVISNELSHFKIISKVKEYTGQMIPTNEGYAVTRRDISIETNRSR